MTPKLSLPDLQKNILTIYSQLLTEVENTTGALSPTYYGNSDIILIPVEHTFDPNSRTRGTIECEWNEFISNKNDTCVAVIEGSLREVTNTIDESFSQEGGEGGFVTFLAHRDHVRTICYEPDSQTIMDSIRSRFHTDHIFYAEMMDRVYQMSGETSVTDPYEYVNYFITNFNTTNNSTYIFQDMIEIHRNYFTKPFDPLDWKTALLIANPFDANNPLISLQQEILSQRDAAIITSITQAYNNSVQQFIVYGSTHVQVFKALLDQVLYQR